MAFSRRGFLLGSAALAATARAADEAFDPWSDGSAAGTEGGIRVRFLGSGAAGWKPEWARTNPHMRRQSSVLLENDDFRLFAHSSVQAVARTVSALQKAGRLALPAGQKVVLTHLGIKYRGWASARIEKEVPETLRAASDGLELVLG